MKQKSKTRKRKFTTATKKKRIVMNENCESQFHSEGQGFGDHTLKGLGRSTSSRAGRAGSVF
jgi:hypothetical protein